MSNSVLNEIIVGHLHPIKLALVEEPVLIE